jgi:hypothetical protein
VQHPIATAPRCSRSHVPPLYPLTRAREGGADMSERGQGWTRSRRLGGGWPTSPLRFSFPSGLAGPAAHETLPFCGDVVGIEVGNSIGAIKPAF